MDRIDNIEKARRMAEAEKPFRDRAIANDNPADDRRAEKIGIEAGEAYDREQKELITKGDTENLEKNSQVFELDRRALETFLGAGNGLVRVLRNREGNRLSPFMEPEEISRLSSGLQKLSELAPTDGVEEIINILQTIDRALDSFGHARVPRGVREDIDSMGNIIFSLKRLQDDASLFRAKVGGETQLAAKLQTISGRAQEKWLLVARKRELLKSYTDGRY